MAYTLVLKTSACTACGFESHPRHTLKGADHWLVPYAGFKPVGAAFIARSGSIPSAPACLLC